MPPPILIVDDNVEFAVLLGTLISEQGMTPVLAHTAETALALAKQLPPAALVLDLLLPDMTGHKLLTTLVKSGLKVPLFVMTGVFKGQAQMEKLRHVSPVSGWHEKPFDTRLLVEQIVKTVGGAQPVVVREEHQEVANVTSDFDINILEPVDDEGIRGPEPRGPAKEPSDDIEVEVEVDDTALAMWDVVGNVTPLPVEEERPDEDPGIVIDDLLLGATSKFTALKNEPEPEPLPKEAMEPVPEATTIPRLAMVPVAPPAKIETDPTLAPFRGKAVPPPAPAVPTVQPPPVQAVPHVQAVPPLPPVPKTADDGFAGRGTESNPFQQREHSPTASQVRSGLRAKMRTGNLKSATVPRLLTAFYISQETGEIVFERNAERKVIYLSEGRPVYARSNQAEDRLGAFAKRAYKLSDAQVQNALQIAKSTDRMVGEVFIAEGMIPQANKQELLREQTRSIIKSLLTWTEGRYVIGFNVQDAIERAELNDHPASLVLSSVRELFDVEKLRQVVPDKMRPMPSPNPPYELCDLPMGDAEALLVLRSTGARPVDAMLKELASRLDEKSARAHIYGLLLLGMLVAGRPPPPAQPLPAAKEVSR